MSNEPPRLKPLQFRIWHLMVAVLGSAVLLRFSAEVALIIVVLVFLVMVTIVVMVAFAPVAVYMWVACRWLEKVPADPYGWRAILLDLVLLAGLIVVAIGSAAVAGLVVHAVNVGVY